MKTTNLKTESRESTPIIQLHQWVNTHREIEVLINTMESPLLVLLISLIRGLNIKPNELQKRHLDNIKNTYSKQTIVKSLKALGRI